MKKGDGQTHSVAILMSTYNGEKYLKQQIDSILAQANVEPFLFVRDDGSTDSTGKILDAYQEHNSNIRVYYGKNIGLGNSFMELLYAVPDSYEYYAFSDQDDIWDADKVIVAIKALSASGKYLYASNQECVDAEGKTIGVRYAEDRKIHLSLFEVLSGNELNGCTMVFPSKLKNILQNRRPSAELLRARIHDAWVAAVASLFASILYDKTPHIKYRQHQNNVVGAHNYGIAYYLRMIRRKLKSETFRNGRSKMAFELCRLFPEQTKDNYLLQACAKADTKEGKRILIKNMDTFRRISGETTMGLALKILVGLF